MTKNMKIIELSDEQLATVTGGGYGYVFNIAITKQTNLVITGPMNATNGGLNQVVQTNSVVTLQVAKTYN